MEELGIQLIFAMSPQAKGRVERTAGIFQDRLITELRLAGATTLEQAKAVLKQFLPRFDRRFGVPTQCPEPAFRPLQRDDLPLEQVLCFKHRRRVARNNTVKYQRHTLNCFPIQSAAATPERLWRSWPGLPRWTEAKIGNHVIAVNSSADVAAIIGVKGL